MEHSSRAYHIDEATELPEPTVTTASAKRVPSRHRHLRVEQSVDDALVERVLESLPKRSADVAAQVAGRMGYSASELPRLRRRVARWKRSRENSSHRMPSHIKVAETLLVLVDECARRAAEPEPKGTLGGALKKVGEAFVSEVKEQWS